MIDLRKAISAFGARARAKLSNAAVRGEPEDQLRAPFEQLLADLSELCGQARGSVDAVGESNVKHLKTRPDYAITLKKALVGFVELKAPGKGADPRRFRDDHDKAQWGRLRSLPNLMYCDGNAFSLWQNGELVGPVVRVVGDIETSGASLDAPAGLITLFENFLGWAPSAPGTAKELAATSARLCRLLRDEVTERLEVDSESLQGLKADWRKLLFPEASDAQFADSYAQAVTFGLLMARARDIDLDGPLSEVAKKLGATSSLIGAALRVLTEDMSGVSELKTSVDTLRRVLGVVDWPKVAKGKPDAWLYFYEDFLDVYDRDLRKLTGSYYTPPEVVTEMVRLVDDVLRSRFGRAEGLAAADVTIADPAVGTGTFLLGVLRQIARSIESLQGPGAVPGKIEEAVRRLVGFELQLGPFAVAQLRIMAEVVHLMSGKTGPAPVPSPMPKEVPALRMYVTDTLGNPYEELEWLPNAPQYKAIGDSRKQANRIKREESITVVIGNPPYKEKAKGRGGWIESGVQGAVDAAPLDAWFPPPDWGVAAHAKHLYNLYVYFWRWATWKVFDHEPKQGVVCFITVAGFLNGPGFQRMREYLRQTADEIWVIACSPEGHQTEVPNRIFQGVQQPVCIVLASRSSKKVKGSLATVRFVALPTGPREDKFAALKTLELGAQAWRLALASERAPLFPAATGAWADFTPLATFFGYSGSGVMPGRTWVIAPDAVTLKDRWRRLLAEKQPAEKEKLFHPHIRKGEPGDKHLHKVVARGLGTHEYRAQTIAADSEDSIQPVRYAFRSFDRQWIIPDARLINQPNPTLWDSHSESQIYLTALDAHAPENGPALTFAGLVPDLHHYKGSFGGRAFPLWRDRDATQPNVHPALLAELTKRLGAPVSAEEVLAYIAAVLANPGFTVRFQPDLKQPGLRVPLTADLELFREAVELGQTVIWLHTYGERFADASQGRPPGPPRMVQAHAPSIPAGGSIPSTPDDFPDELDYDPKARRLKVGKGHVDRVSPAVWAYEVSGKNVLRQWFSYRKAHRKRPLIGDRRPPSPLGDIQPDHWLAEYTTDLLHLLNVLGRLVELEPRQADLLGRICAGPLLPYDDLTAAGAFEAASSVPAGARRAAGGQTTLL